MANTRIVAKAIGVIGVAVLGLALPGCATSEWLHTSRVTQIFSPQPVADNPLVVPINDFEAVWNKTVAEVGAYFDIASENRLSRTIITEPKIGATVLEPWLGDSVTIGDRVESTLQTMRRFAVIKIDPAPAGGFLVKVEVHKELEDMVKPDRQAAGRAVFNNDFPVNRVREVVGPVPVAVGWIPRGRDPNLEQAILSGVRNAFFL
ncbi:hypothetical protein [Paludisphaera borealis]|uniref:Uncharacterized protein n=1 Tax=Paludisphaera borealis TaxID=1387353 RepID=A0A1U7CUZ9_9BACT|nr:hypothetical protein [Paludisphaera borealis]APW62703.1 hypothetical protein BSF38_04254 [Paludisphaera borealis]MDR3617998.1 hypothetical protein [Paludisphaera borealis]